MKIKKRSRIDWLFLLVVVTPTLLSCYYFVSIASNIYISESHFVVRSPQRQTMTGLSAMLQGAGFSHAQNDSYAVHDYILSRDSLLKLEQKFGFKALFSDQKIDVLNRFGVLDFDTSFEALYQYYNEKVIEIKYDTVSSITTINVSAFSPEQAYEINEYLLQMTEGFISQLNQQGRSDILQAAKEELALAEDGAMMARVNTAKYRSKTSTVDPSQQSATKLKQVSVLENSLMEVSTQLALLKRVAPGNSQISTLEARIKQINSAIRKENKKITGNKGSIVSKFSQYEQVIMEQEFANKHYSAAVVAYQQALEEVQRKQLYLERIVQPNKPDYTMYPRRVRAIFTTLILSFLLWAILHMLLAGVREHKH